MSTKEDLKFTGQIVGFMIFVGFFIYFAIAFAFWLFRDPFDIVELPNNGYVGLCVNDVDDDSEPCKGEDGEYYRNATEYWDAKKTETK